MIAVVRFASGGPGSSSINFCNPSRDDLAYPPSREPVDRISGAASVCSSSFFLNFFKMVFSGSSGNRDLSQSPVFSRTLKDLALRTQSGCPFSGTSQTKNWKATTMINNPRARPNRNPRVRSSAPMRRIQHHVRDPDRDDRHQDQRADESAGDDGTGRDGVIVEIGFGDRQQPGIGSRAW